MDYNRTSLQLGTSGTVIVQHDLSQGYNYTNFGLVNSMCIPFEKELHFTFYVYRHRRMMILKVERTFKPEKTVERNFTTFEFIFHQLAAKTWTSM